MPGSYGPPGAGRVRVGECRCHRSVGHGEMGPGRWRAAHRTERGSPCTTVPPAWRSSYSAWSPSRPVGRRHRRPVIRCGARSSGALIRASGNQSVNWSGYAEPGSFTSIGGSWTVPAVSAPPGATTYASTWIGVDGFANRDLHPDRHRVGRPRRGRPLRRLVGDPSVCGAGHQEDDRAAGGPHDGLDRPRCGGEMDRHPDRRHHRCLVQHDAATTRAPAPRPSGSRSVRWSGRCWPPSPPTAPRCSADCRRTELLRPWSRPMPCPWSRRWEAP